MRDNRLEPYFPLSFRWLAYILLPLGIIGVFPAQGFLGVLWPVIAIVAGVAFILAGTAVGIGAGYIAYVGIVHISQISLISFKAFPLAISIASFVGGIFIGFGLITTSKSI